MILMGLRASLFEFRQIISRFLKYPAQDTRHKATFSCAESLFQGQCITGALPEACFYLDVLYVLRRHQCKDDE